MLDFHGDSLLLNWEALSQRNYFMEKKGRSWNRREHRLRYWRILLEYGRWMVDFTTIAIYFIGTAT